jgi:Cu-Zn family superoxide dismutase
MFPSRLTAAAAATVLVLYLAGAASAGGALHASAALLDTNGTSVGWAGFTEDATGIVHVNVHAWGLTPGLHGIHIHTIGTCTLGQTPSAFASAGGHHNPLGAAHGLEDPPGAHAGDLPNLIVNGAGRGHLDVTTDRATLSAGATSVFDPDGSALVIHAGTDDQVTNPTGNSGSRVACGPIVAG